MPQVALEGSSPELRDLESLIIGGEHVFPLLQRETLLFGTLNKLLSSKAVFFTNILEKVVWSTGSQCLLSLDVQKCEGYLESCLPATVQSSHTLAFSGWIQSYSDSLEELMTCASLDTYSHTYCILVICTGFHDRQNSHAWFLPSQNKEYRHIFYVIFPAVLPKCSLNEIFKVEFFKYCS